MKRMALVILLVLSGAAVARADNDLYNNVLKQPRGDDALHADTAICDAQLGAPQNGTATSRPYKRCMLTHAGASVTPSVSAPAAMTAIPIRTTPA